MLEADFEAVDVAGFAGVLAAFETERRRLEAVDVRLLAAADQAQVAPRHCRASFTIRPHTARAASDTHRLLDRPPTDNEETTE